MAFWRGFASGGILRYVSGFSGSQNGDKGGLLGCCRDAHEDCRHANGTPASEMRLKQCFGKSSIDRL